MWCPENHHEQLPLYSLQQVPRAASPLGSAGRQSPRLQPTSPASPDVHAPPYRRDARGTQGNHGRSHRRPGCTVSLATRCGNATLVQPVFPLTPVRTEEWDHVYNRCSLGLVIEATAKQTPKSPVPNCAQSLAVGLTICHYALALSLPSAFRSRSIRSNAFWYES